MSFFSKKDRFRKRTLRFESLEHREMLSVSPLTYPTESTQGQYGSDFDTEAAPDMGGAAVKITDTTSSTMTISWDAAQMTGLRTSDGFTVERLSINTKGEEVWTKIGTVSYSYTTGDGIYSYELTGLTALTEYTHRVSYGSMTIGTGHTERVTDTTDKNEIKADPASSTSITLTWDFAGKKDTKYEIWMNTDGSDNFTDTGKTVMATGTAKTFICTVDNLESATEYTFEIRYYDITTTVQKTKKITCSTQHTLEIGETTDTSVELYWAKAIGGNVESYQLQISSASDSTWKNATSTPVVWQAGDTFDYDTYIKHKISGLKDNETYSFRLRYTIVVDGETVTRYTDPLSYSTPATITVDNVTDTTAVVKWSFPNKSGTAYYVQTRTAGGQWSDYPGANTTGKTYTLKNLDPGTTYEIQIRYTDPKGTTATYFSASETITTAVATTLESVTESTVTISWDIPNRHATQNTVKIQRCDGSLDPKVDSNWKTIATDVADTTYESKYLGSDKEYFFRVVYTDTGGDTQNTLHVSARTVGIVTATESSIDSVTLEWSFTPKDANYTVQYVQSDNPVGWAKVPSGQISDATLNGCTVTGLEKGKPYYFRIVYTPKGKTTTLTSTATEKIYTINANVIVTDHTDTTVTLHWAPNSFTGGAQDKGFVIYVFEASERFGERNWKYCQSVDAATAAKNNYEYTITGLMADIEYQFKIAYSETASNLAQSDTVAVKTDAYEVSVEGLGKTTAQLTWKFDTYKHSPTSTDSGGDSAGVFTVEKYIGTNVPPSDADFQNSDNWLVLNDKPTWGDHYYNLTGLTKNTTYYYRVSYAYQTDVSKQGEGTTYEFPQERKYSQIVEVKTKSDLWTEYVGSNSIKVRWEAQTLTSGSSYTVQARVAGDTGWPGDMQFTVASGKTDYTFENLTAETEYEFRVTFNAGTGETAVLKEKTAKYIPSIVYKEIDVEYATAKIQIGFTGVERDFQLLYRLKTPQGDNGWTDAGATEEIGTKTVSMTVDSIRPELEYEFKIVYTANGSTIESEVISAAISDDLSPEDVDSTSAKITWQASSFSDKRASSDYTVQWREVGATDWKGTTETSSTDKTSYEVKGLEPNKDYEFRILYYTVGDAEAYSTIKTVRTGQPSIAGDAPQVGSVKLTWTFNSYADGFVIQYKDENGQWQKAATVSSNTARETTITALQHTGENLELEKEYTFRIAYKTSQSGDDYVYTDEIEVTTLAGLQIVDNSATTTSVKIKWDYVTDATYQIHYWEKASSAEPDKILGIDKDVKEYELTDLKPGVEYEIKLVYTDGIDKNETIDTKTTVAVPVAPSGITAGDVTSDSATLKWIDNSAFEEDYVLEVINSVTGVVFFKGSIGKRLGSSASATDYATHELTGLDTNTKYTVKLYATNAEGSSAIATGTFTTLDVARPNKVDKIAAATTPKSVTLSWKIKSLEGVPDPTDKTDFRIEYKYTDADKVSNWYVVANATITYNTETETWYAIITDKIEYGNGKSVEFENKTNYIFRVTVLGDTSGATKYGDSLAVEKTAKTTSITVPSSLSATNINLTSATIKFKDTDKTLDASEKTYTIKIVEGKHTDWTKIPADAVVSEFTVDKSTLASSYYYHDLKGLKAGTTYSYVVEWDWAGETIQSKAANFTTKALPKASTVKTGYTLTADGKLANQISWKPPASTKSVPITTDMKIDYVIEVSLTGKAGSFVTLTDSLTLSTSPKGLLYGAVAFSDLAKALPGGVDITAYKSLYIRVGATFKQVDTVIGTSYSSNGKITLPKFS